MPNRTMQTAENFASNMSSNIKEKRFCSGEHIGKENRKWKRKREKKNEEKKRNCESKELDTFFFSQDTPLKKLTDPP